MHKSQVYTKQLSLLYGTKVIQARSLTVLIPPKFYHCDTLKPNKKLQYQMGEKTLFPFPPKIHHPTTFYIMSRQHVW